MSESANNDNTPEAVEFLDDETRPLSPMERRKLREIIRANDRAAWLWNGARVWATWITAVGAALVLLKQLWSAKS